MEYNELKDTDTIWIPKIPKHWDLIKVRHLFKESSIKGFPNEPLLVASQEHGVVTKEVFGKRSMEVTKDFDNLKLVEEEDFVISLRSFQGGIEIAHQKGIISPAYTILKATRPINKRYFKHLFKSKPFISLMTLCVKGIRDGQNIDFPAFKGEYLPFPPLEEQAAIGAYLDRKTQKIQKFIRKKERLVELLEEEKESITFNLLIKGVNESNTESVKDSWLQEKPSHWKVYKGKSIFKIYGGYAPSDLKILKENEFHLPNALNYYKVDDLNNVNGYLLKPSSWKVNSFKLRIIKKGTILLPKRGAAIMTNKVTQASDSCVFDTNIMGIEVDNSIVMTDYICLWLKTRNLIELADITTIPQLNNKHIYPLLISLPDLKEQIEILSKIKIRSYQLESSISIAKSEIEKAKEYRESLITQVVTGQLKVPCNPDVTKRQNINAKPLTIST